MLKMQQIMVVDHDLYVNVFFFFQAEDGIRDWSVTGVQTCALPISGSNGTRGRRRAMSDPHSDALVFFGATGDLAYKKIFPALQAMLKRGHLDVPVIGVAKAGWSLEQFRARAYDSLKNHGGVDAAAFDKLSGLLRYVDGDYADPATFQGIRQ